LHALAVVERRVEHLLVGRDDDPPADRLLQIDKIERTVTAKLEPMEADRKASAVRMRNALQLIAATRQAVIDWAGAHRQMLTAVRGGVSVDPQALVQSVVEVRELIRKVRANE
jgi:hypothetical protein